MNLCYFVCILNVNVDGTSFNFLWNSHPNVYGTCTWYLEKSYSERTRWRLSESGSRLMVERVRLVLLVKQLKKYLPCRDTEKLCAKFGEDQSLNDISMPNLTSWIASPLCYGNRRNVIAEPLSIHLYCVVRAILARIGSKQCCNHQHSTAFKTLLRCWP